MFKLLFYNNICIIIKIVFILFNDFIGVINDISNLH